MNFENLIHEIMHENQSKIKKYIVKKMVKETVNIVFNQIYAEINIGNLHLEGILDKDKIYDLVLEHLREKGEIDE